MVAITVKTEVITINTISAHKRAAMERWDMRARPVEHLTQLQAASADSVDFHWFAEVAMQISRPVQSFARSAD